MADLLKKEQIQIQKTIWFFLLMSWIFRWWSGVLFYQLNNAPFVSVEADNTFWLFHALQFPYFSIHYFYIGIILDLLWLVFAIIGLTIKHNRIISTLMCLLFINYFITFNSVSTHHEHILTGLLFCIILLPIKDHKNFVLVFASIRFYAVFTMFSAGLWKVCRGSVVNPLQMTEILKTQHLDYIVNYPESYYTNFINYLIINPNISNFFWHCSWLIEVAFIIGFLTRKFDKILGIGILLFFFFNYLLMDLFFIEFCIFTIAFYPFKGVWDYYNTKLAISKSI
ncbi:MAG: hypothetical protein MK207_10765 [Saprospiraceae bacterium]|nr:hypothetical protein [Saprospiraceae bacterium]